MQRYEVNSRVIRYGLIGLQHWSLQTMHFRTELKALRTLHISAIGWCSVNAVHNATLDAFVTVAFARQPDMIETANPNRLTSDRQPRAPVGQ